MKLDRALAGAKGPTAGREEPDPTGAGGGTAPKGPALTPGEICRMGADALCGAVRRCMPQSADAAQCPSLTQATCAQVTGAGAGAGPLPTREQLKPCIAAIANVRCEDLGSALLARLSACAALTPSGAAAEPEGGEEPSAPE
jgi:hypothetical protein